MAPIDNISGENTYLEALDWAINNSRINNIALAGPYGCGKSSVIQSYLKSHSKLNAINVSLAAFQENNEEEKGYEHANSDETEEGKCYEHAKSNEIEEAILKQLFYRVSYKNIPQSRYKKLHGVSFFKLMFILGIIAFAIFGLLFVFSYERYSIIVDLIVKAGLRLGMSKTWSKIGAVCTFVLLDIMLSKICIILLSNIKVKEVRLPDNTTIATGSEGDTSVFNRSLDEIVYYFEEMKYDIVFFEDLDRLNNSDIFVKLRELNILLNSDSDIKNPVKFVYAVRDDIFIDKDRTKFFEFIIPIVPIINSTNSGEMLTQLKNERNEEVDISEEYILNISPYISDMRLLQNAYNEFLIYKEILQTGQALNLKDEIMLSLVIFKNLYPKEFAELQAEEGVVKQAFRDKAVVIEKLRQKLQNEVDESSELLEGCNSDVLDSKRELVASFFCAVTNWEGIAYQISIGGTYYKFDDFLQSDFDFDQIIDKVTGDKVTVQYSYVIPSSISSNRLNKSIPRTFFESYAKRFRQINIAEESRIEVLRKDIELKQQQIYSIEGYTLKELIEEFGVDQVLSDSVKSIRPLVYMLRMGYIDERYADYINYFKGTSITTDDMNFILSVKNHESLPFNYKLTKIDQITNRLQPYEFEQKEILNFELLEHLLSSNANNEKLYRLIGKISDGTDNSLRFLDEFIEKTSQHETLFMAITSTWSGLWDTIINNAVMTRDRKNYYLMMILNYADLDGIVNQNTKGKVSSYFIDNVSILEDLSNVPESKLISVIDKLQIKFVDVELKHTFKRVSSHIVDESCYEICLPMMQRIVGLVNSELQYDLNKHNYTTLLSMNYEPVLNYIHENWDKYINEIILTQDNTEENVEVVGILIKKSIPDVKTCTKLINHLNFVFENLEDFTFDKVLNDEDTLILLWNQLLSEDKINPIWSNVNTYWNRFGLTSELLEYVERKAKCLIDSDSSGVEERFVREYLCSNGNDDSYRVLTAKLKLEEFDLKISKIPENRLKVLLDNRYFAFNVNIYDQIFSFYPTLLENAVLANQAEFITFIEDVDMNKTTMDCLVKNKLATTNLKNSLFRVFGKTRMSETVANELCMQTYSIDKDVFFSAWNYLTDDRKKELLYNYSNLLDAVDFERCFEDIEEFYSFCDRTRHQVDLPNDKNNQKLADRLEEVDYISSWKEIKRRVKRTTDKEQQSEYQEVIVCNVKAVK